MRDIARKKTTIEEVKSFCNEIGLECISDKYIDIKSKLKFRCPQCGETYLRNFDNLKQRKSPLCSLCGRRNGSKKLAYTYDDVKSFVENNECKLVSREYKNVDTHLLFICKCGNTFETTFYKFNKRTKRQCNECTNKRLSISNATPDEDIKNYIEKFDYTFIKSVLPGSDQKIFIQCEEGHEPYWTRFISFKNGKRCPHCYRSLGEEMISKELDKLGIKYLQEHTFENLTGIGGKPLRYDFAILNKNNIECLVEYDGIQHFEPVEHFGGEDYFRIVQKHDSIKNNYAKENQIPIYRIPYTKRNNIQMIVTNIIEDKYKI